MIGCYYFILALTRRQYYNLYNPNYLQIAETVTQVGTCMYWFPPLRVVNQPLSMNTAYKYWSPPMPIEKQSLDPVTVWLHIWLPQQIGIRHSTCRWRHDTSGTGTTASWSSYTV